MIDSIYSSYSALNAATEKQGITSNNIANSTTPGYKSKRASQVDASGGGTYINSVNSNNTESYIIRTGNNLDLAINGRGYFKLDNGNSNIITRNGSFRIDENRQIVDNEGNVLFRLNGGLTNNEIRNINIDKEGNIYTGNRFLGRLEIVDKYGNTIPENNYEILSGYLEASNVDMTKELVDNLINLRYLQANAESFKTSDELIGTIVNLKG
ncbi:MAG: flagellar hook basal-body protein [Deferribacterota bacterium]|nr:flagellar hook basal-body protein [Deferribacterota bacterium]